MSLRLEIKEFDEAGNLTATYVQTPSSGDTKRSSRVDVIAPPDPKSLWQKGLDVFLPVGYPNSVTHDYLEYQIYDSLQAFSSSIAGLLSSRAVLSSVGVGDSSASPTAALLLSIFQESAGRLATILFAHRFGTALEPECKMYRLLADILNDTGFLLDCLSPLFPRGPFRMLLLSFSSILRALCGVAAGSAKASLSAHFAKWGNLGELNAKDSSQETVISLLGMWVGSLVVTWVTTPVATWTVLVLLLGVHLETNRRAVRAVSMRSLNRQRAMLVYYELCSGRVPTPEEVSAKEKIFERDGVLRSEDGTVVGHCAVGVPLSRLLTCVAERDPTTDSVKLENRELDQILACYREMPYLLWADKSSPTRRRRNYFVVLQKGAGPRDALRAWWQALALANKTHPGAFDVELFARTAKDTLALFQKYEDQLKAKGWDLDASALETTSSTRVLVEFQ